MPKRWPRQQVTKGIERPHAEIELATDARGRPGGQRGLMVEVGDPRRAARSAWPAPSVCLARGKSSVGVRAYGSLLNFVFTRVVNHCVTV
jgi:hypothetical protein